jgi:penicillin-binding protein 2
MLPLYFRVALPDSSPGSVKKTAPQNDYNCFTITVGLAAATTSGTAAAAHLDGIDFAGKTGTAQVTGLGDTHVKGGSKTPNAWFVGMVPRRNPEFAIVVLQEHGDWGANSAIVAALVVNAYVSKQRRNDHNLNAPEASKPVEVGAIWSDPQPANSRKSTHESAAFHAGHFFVTPSASPAATASGLWRMPAWLHIWQPIRFRQEHN